MNMKLSKEQVTDSLRRFVSRRDNVLHEDISTFEHNLDRFVAFCNEDELAKEILQPLKQSQSVDVNAWWGAIGRDPETVKFPDNPDAEILLRFEILESLVKNPPFIFNFGFAFGKSKRNDASEIFRSVVVRPLADELTHRLGDVANIATPEERALQAVPLSRIPSATETKIFLSHKSVDKPLVLRYYRALKEMGFEPWLDEPEMPAGANLERGLLKGFQESCAAVFFITENFKDEKYLATEIDYAIMQKRTKDRKFAIVTLRYPNSSPIPGLLTTYVYKDVTNDLEGYYEVIRALPIELGPIRWKAGVITD
jgi:hypothetical protein